MVYDVSVTASVPIVWGPLDQASLFHST